MNALRVLAACALAGGLLALSGYAASAAAPETPPARAGEALRGLPPASLPLPPCDHSLPEPPLLTVIDGGQAIPTHEVRYDLDSSTVRIYTYTRIFCDGFEVDP